MTEEQFLKDVSPLPEYSDFYYINGDLSLGEFAFSRAYFKFKNFEELLIFKDKFDDYVFMDSRGNEFPAIVEYAPLQKMPRRSGDMKLTKQDSKMNTIEKDTDYINFVEEMKNSLLNNPSPPPHSADTLLEEIENRDIKDNISKMTPLLEYISKRHEDKIKFKEEKQRKKVEAKKKKVEEKKVKENKIKESFTNKSNRKQENSSDKKEEKKIKPDATYIIKVNTEDNNKLKQSEHSVIKESKSISDKKTEKERGPRIRNKDRPAREIYRPGTKPKFQTQTNNDLNGFSSSKNGIDDKKQTNNANQSGNCGNNGNQLSSQQQQPKFKNRVFTRTNKN